MSQDSPARPPSHDSPIGLRNVPDSIVEILVINLCLPVPIVARVTKNRSTFRARVHAQTYPANVWKEQPVKV